MKAITTITIIMLTLLLLLSMGAETNATNHTAAQRETNPSKGVFGPIQPDGFPYPMANGLSPVGLNHTTLDLWPGLYSVAAGVIDPEGGFAYFAAQTSPSVLVKIRLTDFSRAGAIVLDAGGVSSAVIDAAAGYGYFGAEGWVLKVRLSDLTQVDRLNISGGRLTAAAIDPAAGYAYFGSNSQLTRVRLSDFSVDGTIDLLNDEENLSQALVDPGNGYVYFIAQDWIDFPNIVGRIIKVKLSDFSRVDHLDMLAPFTTPGRGAIDIPDGHIYVGTRGGILKVSLASFSIVDDLTEVHNSPDDSVVINPGSGFAFFTNTNEVIQVRLSDLVKVKEISLEQDEAHLQTALMDPGTGHAYFAIYNPNVQGKVVKVNLSDLSRVGALKLSAGEDGLTSAVIDGNNGYAYFGTSQHPIGVIAKIRLSDFSRAGALTLPTGFSGLSAGVIDPVAGYAYFNTGGGRVIKIRLSDFTFVDYLSLSQFVLWRNGPAVIDSDGGYAYFVASADVFGTKDLIYKVRLSDFSLVDTLDLEVGEKALVAAVIDPSKGYAYFGTNTEPAKVIRVRLSDFTRDGAVTLVGDERFTEAAAIDSDAGFAYFSTFSVSGARIVKIRLSDFTRVGAISYGERPIESAVIDPIAELAYFGTGSIQGRILTVRLSDFTGVEEYYLDEGEDLLRSAVIDPTTGIPYFGAYTMPGKVIKYAQTAFEYEAYVPLVAR